MEKEKKNRTKALVLIATPFQAFYVKKILEKEEIKSYDLIYFRSRKFNQKNKYFYELALDANESRPCFSREYKYNVLKSINYAFCVGIFWLKKRYDFCYLASIESPIINSLARNKSKKIITFDDGSGNYNLQSEYFIAHTNKRDIFYAKIFGATPVDKFSERILRHYTVNKIHKNIVSDHSLIELNPFNCIKQNSHSLNETKRIFIGHVYDAISADQVSRIKSYIKKIRIDYYLMHPDNTIDIIDDHRHTKLLKDFEVLAEELIIGLYKTHPVEIYGLHTSVFYNLYDIDVKKTMIIFKDNLIDLCSIQIKNIPNMNFIYI